MKFSHGHLFKVLSFKQYGGLLKATSAIWSSQTIDFAFLGSLRYSLSESSEMMKYSRFGERKKISKELGQAQTNRSKDLCISSLSTGVISFFNSL